MFSSESQTWKNWNVYLVLQKDSLLQYLFKIWLAEYFKNNSPQTLLVNLKWSIVKFTFCVGWISKMAASSRHSLHFQIRSHVKKCQNLLNCWGVDLKYCMHCRTLWQIKKKVFKGMFLAWSSVKFRIFFLMLIRNPRFQDIVLNCKDGGSQK